MMAALLISELPVIFKKYNIKLFRNNINLWVNPRDNVASVFDVERVLNNADNLKMTNLDKLEQFVRQYFYFVKVYYDNELK